MSDIHDMSSEDDIFKTIASNTNERYDIGYKFGFSQEDLNSMHIDLLREDYSILRKVILNIAEKLKNYEKNIYKLEDRIKKLEGEIKCKN